MPRISTLHCGYNADRRSRTCSACHMARRLSREAITSREGIFGVNSDAFKTSSFAVVVVPQSAVRAHAWSTHGQLIVSYLADGRAPAVAVSLLPMLQATNFIMRPPPRMAKRPGSCHSLAFTHSFLH